MRLHYAWIVAGVTFLALLASAGIRATNVVLVLPLEHDFGRDRATVSLALSVNLLLYGLCGPFAGALISDQWSVARESTPRAGRGRLTIDH